MKWPTDYERDNQGRICQRYMLITNNEVSFTADDVRKERTGSHACIYILMNGISLAWGQLNYERDEDRVRIANSSYSHLEEIDRGAWTKTDHKKALDEFCRGLWAEHISQDIGEDMEGDPDLGPPTLLCSNYIIEGGGTILYAPPGRGKSYTALIMARCVDSGLNGLWTTQRRKVLFVNLERSRESMQRRLTKINLALGLPAREPLTFVNARGKSLADVADAVEATIKAKGCELLFLDSISRAGAGSLVEDTAANRIIDLLNGLARSWFALGHTPRNDDAHLYGSQMFDAGEDIGIRLSAKTAIDRTAIGLKVTKANDIPLGGIFVFELHWDVDGLVAITQGESGNYPDLVATEKLSPFDACKEYLLLVGEADAATIGKETGIDRSNVSRYLNASAEIQKHTVQNGRVLFSIKSLRFE